MVGKCCTCVVKRQYMGETKKETKGRTKEKRESCVDCVHRSILHKNNRTAGEYIDGCNSLAAIGRWLYLICLDRAHDRNVTA